MNFYMTVFVIGVILFAVDLAVSGFDFGMIDMKRIEMYIGVPLIWTVILGTLLALFKTYSFGKFWFSADLILCLILFWMEMGSEGRSVSVGSGRIRPADGGPEYTVLTNNSYHQYQIYRGSDIYSEYILKIEFDEFGKGGNVCIRNSSNEIRYVMARDTVYGCWYVYEGSEPYGSAEYTVFDEYVCRGRDPLRNDIIWKIRSDGSDRSVIERY